MAQTCSALSQWVEQVSTQFEHLSQPQARVLAWYSFGMLVAQSSGRSSVVTVLAQLLEQQPANLRERLRDWCKDASAKHGAQRDEVDVAQCFAPLLRWILSHWDPQARRVALILDASTLGTRFTVLAISVACNGCSIPVAWHIVRATRAGAWKRHWCRLLKQVRASLPADWLVLVLADRGLWAPWLYRAICAHGWHPFLRINQQGRFQVVGRTRWRYLRCAAPRPHTQWSGRVTCFKRTDRHVVCTLLAAWEPAQAEAWLILTDLEPAQAEVAWYGMRSWIECGFKDVKRGGLHWEQTKMTHPRRAARLWLAMALALFWSVAHAQHAEPQPPASGFDALPPKHVARRNRRAAQKRRRAHAHATRSTPRRELSLFRHGLLVGLATLMRGAPLQPFRFAAFAWPRSNPP